jgi:hypothetical protein
MPRTLFVILDREHIGEVMRGERRELPVHDPAPVGAKVALKVAAHRRPTVTVEVTACQPDEEGHTLTVRTIPLEHEPRLLSAKTPVSRPRRCRHCRGKDVNCTRCQGTGYHDPIDTPTDDDLGYTSFAPSALSGTADPGEAVPAEYQDHLVMRAMHRDTKRRREQSLAARRDRELLTVLERIDLARAAARENHVDIGTDLVLLRRSMRERRSENAISRRLEDVEARAYRDAA